MAHTALPSDIDRRASARWRGAPDAPWRWASRLLAVSVLVPLAVILGSWLYFDPQIWVHLGGTILPQLLGNTFLLLVGVATGTLLLGVSLAWLTAACEFPGRRILDWALMMPFALPAYVLAFVFVGVMDFSGPVQSGLRALFGLSPAWSFEVRTTFGVVLVMTLVLYPYVYMLARVSFLGQGQSAYEAARSLGLGPWGAFFRVSLPMARPGIIAGLSLALMEALADFGAVAVFNFDTFTTAIYKAWFGFFDLQSAAQLASILLLIVLAALVVERRYRYRARFTDTARSGSHRRIVLRGGAALSASAFAWGIFLVAFVAPVVRLVSWAWGALDDLDLRYLDLFTHTFFLGAMAGVLTVFAAFVLAYANRYHADTSTALSVRIGTLGYALPGSVLAVGVMLSLTWFDHRVADAVEWLTGAETGLMLSGTVLALLMAYFARFLAVAYGPVDSGLERIRPSIRDAARSLGAGQWETVRRVYLPMLRPGLLTAGLLVLVDVMKEMPATLLLRPFGWDTLAVRIYELTSEGEWERAALPAVALLAVGLLPVILLVRRSAR
ncbi:MAG: iron ABC transporter permease [Chromatiaceae bacterium]|nr:iron ABC transporter permease [Gammaproteobacteria bacterium]MCP5304824.1 iron ABC transporter permease [Chromatiaceae bacterium]MCP5314783.1 iron ABC transporter permease [Chromatiaceae bacterium]